MAEKISIAKEEMPQGTVVYAPNWEKEETRFSGVVVNAENKITHYVITNVKGMDEEEKELGGTFVTAQSGKEICLYPAESHTRIGDGKQPSLASFIAQWINIPEEKERLSFEERYTPKALKADEEHNLDAAKRIIEEVKLARRGENEEKTAVNNMRDIIEEATDPERRKDIFKAAFGQAMREHMEASTSRDVKDVLSAMPPGLLSSLIALHKERAGPTPPSNQR